MQVIRSPNYSVLYGRLACGGSVTEAGYNIILTAAEWLQELT